MNRHDEDDPWLTHISVEGVDGVVRMYELPNGGAYRSTVHEKMIQYVVQQAKKRSFAVRIQSTPPRSTLRITPLDIFGLLCFSYMSWVFWFLFFGRG